MWPPVGQVQKTHATERKWNDCARDQIGRDQLAKRRLGRFEDKLVHGSPVDNRLMQISCRQLIVEGFKKMALWKWAAMWFFAFAIDSELHFILYTKIKTSHK